MNENIEASNVKHSDGKGECPVCAERERLARCNMAMQKTIGSVFDPETALRKGTVFPALYMPYEPNEAR